MKRSILICLVGIVLSAVVFSILVEADRIFMRADLPAAEVLNQIVWRNDYLYSPIVVMLVSGLVALFDRTRARLVTVCIAILPFILFQLAANSFSGRGFILAICHIAFALGVAFFISRMQHRGSS